MGWFILAVVLYFAFIYFKQRHQKSRETALEKSIHSDRIDTSIKPGPRAKTAEESLDAAGWDTPADLQPSNPRPIQATLALIYRDAYGSPSERYVDVRECDTTNRAGYLIGYCHLRRDIRTFRIDRIQRATDVDTGEIIADLNAYAAMKYAASPIASLEKLLDDAMDAMRALFFIGKADGRFTAKEKAVFLDYCRRATGDHRISAQQIDAACKCLPTPSLQAYKLICGRLAKLDEAKRTDIQKAAEAMVATEKTTSPEEAEAIAYMDRRFKNQ